MKAKQLLYIPIFLITTIYLFTLQGCRDDDFLDDPDIELSFSVDTLLFDTVFTTLGSATKSMRIYNKHNKRIRISSIELGGGTSSYFRINIDGEPGHIVHDIYIEPKDSVYIFAEVTLDPVNQDLPYIITDSIIFRINENVQKVNLVAWGQDANFIRPNSFFLANGDTVDCHLITHNTTWTSDLPYVVYGLVLVTPGNTLTIEQGARIHMYNNASIVFWGESTFKVMGTLDDPVTIEGVRLEKHYRERPGQWGRIWMMATSHNHEINNAVIKNGTVGLHVDSIGSNRNPTLRLNNTFIRNMSIAGILAQGSHVVGENVVVSNCGEYAAILSLGGKYDFRHSTFANYYNISIRQTPSLVLNNYYQDVDGNYQVRDLEKAYFGNTIIYGNLEEEVLYDFYSGEGLANYTFDHVILKTIKNTDGNNYTNVIKNENPQFYNISENDYRILESSPAVGAGNTVISIEIPYDILGNSRHDRSDIGAYQFYEEVEEVPGDR